MSFSGYVQPPFCSHFTNLAQIKSILHSREAQPNPRPKSLLGPSHNLKNLIFIIINIAQSLSPEDKNKMALNLTNTFLQGKPCLPAVPPKKVN